MKSSEVHEVEKGVEEFENAIEQTGFGKYNLWLLILGGGSVMTVIIETMGLAYIIPAAQCDLNLTISDKSIISSMSFLGIILSSLFWGILADYFGRRKLLIIAMFNSCIFGFLSSIVPYVWMFIVCRFLNGLFIGCPSAVAIPYIGEFHSNRYRAKVISWTGAFIATASLYLPGLSWVILPMEWEFSIPILGILMRPWRLLIIIFSLPSLLIAIAFLRFSESPKFLWSTGKYEKCLETLRVIYATNTGKDKCLYPVMKFESNINRIKETNVISSSKSVCQLLTKLLKQLKKQIIPLFTMPLLPNMALTSGIQFGILAGAHGVFLWVPEMFNRIALFLNEYPTETVSVCKAFNYLNNSIETELTEFSELNETSCTDSVDEGVFGITLIFGAVNIAVFILLGFIVDIVGKKLLLIIILIITTSGGILINSMQTLETIVLSLGMYQLMGPCINLVLSIQVDLFPTLHRAKSVAISQMVGRIGSFFGSTLVGFLLGWHCASVFYIFSGVYIVLILLSLLLPIPLIPQMFKK